MCAGKSAEGIAGKQKKTSFLLVTELVEVAV